MSMNRTLKSFSFMSSDHRFIIKKHFYRTLKDFYIIKKKTSYIVPNKEFELMCVIFDKLDSIKKHPQYSGARFFTISCDIDKETKVDLNVICNQIIIVDEEGF